MATKAPIRLKYNPTLQNGVVTVNNAIGPQSVAEVAGRTPPGDTPADSNSFFFAKTGNDGNAGTAASPKITLDSVFKSLPSVGTDLSGNGNTLTEKGTVPLLFRDSFPHPASGNFAAGPFSTINYLSDDGGGLKSAMSNKTNWSVDFYIYMPSFSPAQCVMALNNVSVSIEILAFASSSGYKLRFMKTGLANFDTVAVLTFNQWYHVAFSTDLIDGVSARRWWIGGSIDNNEAVNPGTPTNPTLFFIGTDASYGFVGYLDRLILSTPGQTTFPTLSTASGIKGRYEFETASLFSAQAAAGTQKKYLILQDSGEYNEKNILINSAYDCAWAYDAGIYASDTMTPTLSCDKGADPGTFGSRVAGRTVFYTGSGAIKTVKKDGTADYSTIQSAISGCLSGDCVEIQDSEVYTEDLIVTMGGTANLTIQAKDGCTPTISNVSVAPAARNLYVNGNPLSVYLYGLTFDDNFGGNIFGGTGGAYFFATDCTLKNSTYLITDVSVVLNFTSCFFINCPISLASVAVNFTNCFFTSPALITSLCNPANNILFERCSFYNQNFELRMTQNNQYLTIDRCWFHKSTLTFQPSVTYYEYFVVSNCEFDDANLVADTIGEAAPLFRGAISNCWFHDYAGTAITLRVTSYGTVTATVRDTVISNCTTGIGYAGAVYGYIAHCAILNCTTALSLPNTVLATGLAGFGNSTWTTGGISAGAGQYCNSNTAFAGTGIGTENASLVAPDPNNFTGNVFADKNIGSNSALVKSNIAWTLNGLYVVGQQNMEGGCTYFSRGTNFTDFSLTVKYCDFTDCGNFGIQMKYGSVSKCLFATSGYGVQNKSGEILNCTFRECPSAAVAQYSQAPKIWNISVYACAYGVYLSLGMSCDIRNCILSGNGVYDYSGDGEIFYSCVGTLDPSRVGFLDTQSITSNPLFVAPMSGNLQLKSIAGGYHFDSPCIGKDMGAWDCTYTQPQTESVLIDFGTPGWTNPDNVKHSMILVNGSSGQTESGRTYGQFSAAKERVNFTWASNCDMPAAQVEALKDLIKCGRVEVEIDFTGGDAWTNWCVDIGEALTWEEDPATGYTDDAVPTPVASIAFVEA